MSIKRIILSVFLVNFVFTFAIFAGNVGPTSTDPYAWWKSDDGVQYDNENFVTRWDDSSGNGRYLDALNDPVYVPDGHNGLPVIEMGGDVDKDQFEAPSSRYSPDKGMIFSVWQTGPGVDDDGEEYLFDAYDLSGDYRQGFVIKYRNGQTVAGGTDSSGGNFIGTTDQTYNMGEFYQGTVKYDTDGYIRINGNEIVSGNTNTGSANGIRIGNITETASHAWTGQLAEFLVYEGELPLTEQVEIESYLMNKWAVPEPATLFLFAVGGALVKFKNRRNC